MESDLSLIEISGEDDSLLQQIPNDDVSSSSKSLFSCSPLQAPRSNRSANRSRPSPIVGKMGNEDMEKPSSSSHRDGMNKENINTNKADVPKLSAEPQQMKRKKKGGGYNLRKSLAWNRAFFTEEGVLDPLELSIISGGFSKSSGEMLSVIHEEGRESLSGNLDCASDLADLQALKENIFKELPTSTLNGDRKIAGALPPKHDSPARANAAPTSAAKRKVLSAQDVNRSGSKRSGCPRPVASSSLKRPATVNTTKTATKESKLSKILVTKPSPCLHSTTAKSATLGASYIKCNQIAQPAVNLQKKAGLKGSSRNTKSATNDAKAVPDSKTATAKSSIQQARRNVANSALQIQSSSKSQRPPVTVANNSLGVVPGPVLSVTDHASNVHEGGSKIVVSLTQNAHYIGGSLQYAQIQTSKPSGLRRPSPSLGFFGQPKASTSHSQLQRSTQPCNLPKSSIPNLRKLGALNPNCELRPLPVPGIIPKVISDAATNGNTRVLSLNPGCSGPSTVDPSLREKIKSNLEVIHVQNVEVKAPYDPKDCETINNQKQLHSILDNVDKQYMEHEEQYKTEKIAHMDEVALHRNDNTMILEGGVSEQLKKGNDNKTVADDCPNSRDSSGGELGNPQFMSQLSAAVQVEGVSGTNIMIEHQNEEKQYNSSIKNHGSFSESQSRDAPSYGTCGTSKVHDDRSSDVHDVNKQSGKQAELQKPCTSEVDQISNEDSQRLQTNKGDLFEESESSEEFQKYDSAEVADVNPKVQYCSASELEKSHAPSLSECTEQAEDSANGVNNIRKSHVGDAQVQCLEGNLSVESGNDILSTSAVDNQYSMVVDDINENFAERPELPTPYFVVQQVFQDNSGSNLNDCLWHGKRFSFQESQQDILQDSKSVVPEASDTCGSELKSSGALFPISNVMQDCGLGVADLQPGDDISYCHRGTSIVQNDWSCTHEVNKQSLEESTADVSPKVKGSGRSRLESPHGLSQDKCTDQANKGVSAVNIIIERSLKEDAQVQSSNQYTMVVDDVNEQSGEHPELQNPSLTADQVPQDNQGFCLNDDLMISNNTSSEESNKRNVLESVSDVGLEPSDACRSEYKSSKVCTQAALAMQDGIHVEKTAGYSHVEDVMSGSIEIVPSIEDLKSYFDMKFGHDNHLSGQAASLESDSSLKIDQISGRVTACQSEAFCSSNKELGLSLKPNQTLSSGSGLQGIEVDALKKNILPEEVETSISQKSNSPDGEPQSELDNAMCLTENKDATISLKKSGNDGKQDGLVIKPPPHAVPFSDEWLAAFEAAGEKILTTKSGPVQNSPPEKSLPEPGPWSPVRRKNNQEIGPFDCTKFTNSNIPPSGSP